jgi:hypothetical protein
MERIRRLARLILLSWVRVREIGMRPPSHWPGSGVISCERDADSSEIRSLLRTGSRLDARRYRGSLGSAGQ